LVSGGLIQHAAQLRIPYTPAIASRFVERMMEGPKSQEERDKQLKEYGRELLGPNPL
jgi:hypothetical protein